MHKPDLKSPQSMEVYTRKSFLVRSVIAEVVGCAEPDPNHNMATIKRTPAHCQLR